MNARRTLQRLAQALTELHSLTLPELGRGDHIPTSRQHSASDPTGHHVANSHWLRLYRRRLHELEQLTDRIHADIHGQDPTRPEQWRCNECGRYQRPAASYCDRCGQARPNDLAVSTG